MKNAMNKLWDEYFNEECAVIDTDEERAILRTVIESEEAACASLTQEQRERVEEYAEAIYKGEGAHVKKAFFKGCEFAASFLVSLGISAEK